MTIAERLDEMQRAADAAIVRDGTYAAVVAIETQPRLIAALREAGATLTAIADARINRPSACAAAGLARIAELLDAESLRAGG